MPEEFDLSSSGFNPFLSNNNNNNSSSVDGKKKNETISLEKEQGKALKDVSKSIKNKTKEEIAENQRLILKLTSYGNHNRFKTFLESHNFKLQPSSLKGYDNEELKDLLVRVQTTIGSKNNDSFIETGIIQTINFIETMLMKNEKIKNNFNISGLSNLCKQDESLLDAIAEISLEYSDLNSLSADKRIVLILLKNVSHTLAFNRLMQRASLRLREQATVPVSTASSTASPTENENFEKSSTFKEMEEESEEKEE